MSSEQHDKHRRWVANYFSGKVKELGYHLGKIIEACNESLRLFHVGEQVPPENNATVTYGFSAFTNVAVTLKDSASTFLNVDIPWSTAKKLTHGDFVFSCRNAATHDGHPIISMWADGRYYVPTDIMRLDNKKELVRITAPSVDIRTLCLKFTYGYCEYLNSILFPGLNNPMLQGANLSIDEITDGVNHPFIPDFAKQMLIDNSDQVRVCLQGVQKDPVQTAIHEISTLMDYCRAALNTNSP